MEGTKLVKTNVYYKDAEGNKKYQLVRNGYFNVDPKASTNEHLVLNRIVSLKSSFKL